MNELIEFQIRMLCPACAKRMYREYSDGPARTVKPKFCNGKKGLFSSCKRNFPHLHWKCEECECPFVTETSLGQERMKQIT